MKSLLALSSLLLLVSCNEAEHTPVAATPPIKRDSNTIIKREVANPYAPLDISPMDISYFPNDYPVARMTGKTSEPPVARVIYSRPHRQGRTIFGSLLKYGEPWRLGANEATEIEFFRSVTIQGKTVARGRYILYCIPQEKEWTIVFNDNVFSWGLRQDPKKDAYRFTIPAERKPQVIEYFTMVFQRTQAGADLVIAWEDVAAKLPITL